MVLLLVVMLIRLLVHGLLLAMLLAMLLAVLLLSQWLLGGSSVFALGTGGAVCAGDGTHA